MRYHVTFWVYTFQCMFFWLKTRDKIIGYFWHTNKCLNLMINPHASISWSIHNLLFSIKCTLYNVVWVVVQNFWWTISSKKGNISLKNDKWICIYGNKQTWKVLRNYDSKCSRSLVYNFFDDILQKCSHQTNVIICKYSYGNKQTWKVLRKSHFKILYRSCTINVLMKYWK